jgi:hypothetical protein
MKRTTGLLAIVFVVLGGAALWYLLHPEDDKTSILAKERNFAVEDTAAIYKIFIADRKGESTTLERKDGYWLYNGTYKARPNAMENLLDVIRRVQVKYKPPTPEVDNMIRTLAADGLKVEIYGKNDRLLRAYYVGGATADERGTYMIIDGVEQPYVTYIPSWEGSLRFRYNLKGNDWRDKTVFAEKVDDIAFVSIEYPKQRNKSFQLKREGKSYRITPFYEVTPVINRPYREGSAEAFLSGFKSIAAEAFENNNPRRDSILQLVPFSIITVRNKAGQETAVRLFPIFLDYQDPEAVQLPGSVTVERYFADCSSGNFMLVQNILFSKILWAYDFFFENP